MRSASARGPRWRARVRVRVTTAATTVALIGAVIGSVVFVGGLQESLEQSLITAGTQQAGTVDAQLRSGTAPEDAVVSAKQDLVVQIITADGRIVATNHPEVTSALQTTAGDVEGVSASPLVDTYAVHALASTRDRLVVVGVSEEQQQRAVRIATEFLAISVPVGIALIGVVVWLSIGRALRPVERMREEAATITSEHLHRRLPVPAGDDEIPRLAETLNLMLDGIDTAHQAQRRFVADASHELRSPLANLRQTAETAQRQPTSTSVPELASRVMAEEQRMEALVEALLTLARLENTSTSRSQLVDLDDLVLDEVGRRRTADASTIDLSAVSAGQVVGDPVLLRQVLSNLLANAERHAATTITVSLHEEASHVVLAVEDDGTGVPISDRDRIFDRFARLDQARARDAGGSGLGLAIVKTGVEAHGGAASVEEGPEGGARFVIKLPRAHEP